MKEFYLHWYAKNVQGNPCPKGEECYRIEDKQGHAIDGYIFTPMDMNAETQFGKINEELLYRIDDVIKIHRLQYCGMIKSFY